MRRIQLIPTLLLICLSSFSSLLEAQIDNAIVIVPQIDNFGPVFSDNCYEAALDKLGIPYNSYLEASDFLLYGAAIQNADAPSTLVIVDNWFLFPLSWAFIGLDNFIQDGGTVIFSSFNLDAVANSSTKDLLGIDQVTDDNQAFYNMYDWGSSNLFAGLPSPVEFDASAFMVNSTSNMLTMSPMSTASVVGGFIPVPDMNNGSVVVHNGGKTLAIGGCIHFIQDQGQCELFAENMIREVLGLEAIPTIGEWGMVILIFIILIAGVVAMKYFRKLENYI